MKKVWVRSCFFFFVFMIAGARVSAQDPITVIIKEGIKKVIVAVDLKIQRLQNEVIWLQNAQKVVENTVSKLRLDEITDWVERQKDIYQDYFDELRKVKDLVSYYHKVRDISSRQVMMAQEYRRIWNGIRQDQHFSAEEVLYMGRVCAGILEQSIQNMDKVLLVVRSFSLEMSDAKRIELIDNAAAGMEQNYADLKSFGQQCIQLSMQRAKDINETAHVKRLYGLL